MTDDTPNSDQLQESSVITLRGIGLDSFWNILNDYSVRAIRIDDSDFFSLVDLMRVFGNTSNPRRYWSDHKRELLDNDPELYEKIVQLKARAEDKKMRSTDFAPRWVCLYIVLGMHTSVANAFRKATVQILDSMSKAAVKYRAMNVDQGMEWAADTTHEAMKKLGPTKPGSAWEDLGYDK